MSKVHKGRCDLHGLSQHYSEIPHLSSFSFLSSSFPFLFLYSRFSGAYMSVLILIWFTEESCWKAAGMLLSRKLANECQSVAHVLTLCNLVIFLYIIGSH